MCVNIKKYVLLRSSIAHSINFKSRETILPTAYINLLSRSENTCYTDYSND